MKKILIFSLAYFPHVGGAEVAIRRITNRMAVIEPEVKFYMITLRFSKNDQPPKENIEVHYVGFGSSYFSKIFFIPLAAIKALRLHKEHHFDAFWAMMSYMLFPIVLIRWFGIKIPYILTLQEGDPFEHMFKRLRILPFLPMLKSGFYHATVIQVISNYLATWARAMDFKGQIEVIPNGSASEWFGVDLRQNKEAFWKDKNIPSGLKLITTSRLVYKNGIDTVILSMSLLPKGTQFLILGGGKEKTKLDNLAKTLRVSDRVHFLGEVPNTRLLGWLHASDIFIRPSRSEGMGNSFVEAMAAGLPVIATQEGGISDFLFDEKRNPNKETTGWAVDKDSPEQIAKAVKEILSDPEKVSKVVATAKKMAIEKYDWNLIAQNMKEKVFNKVLNK